MKCKMLRLVGVALIIALGAPLSGETPSETPPLCADTHRHSTAAWCSYQHPRRCPDRPLRALHRSPAPWKGQWWGTQPVAQPRPPKVVEVAGTKLVLETLRAALGDANAAVRRAAVDSVAVTKDAEAANSPECAAFFRKVHDADKAQLE